MNSSKRTFLSIISCLAALVVTLHTTHFKARAIERHYSTEANAMAEKTAAIAQQSSSSPDDGETQKAWDVFASLTHPDQPRVQDPAWSNWKGKCSVGFTSDCDNTPSPKKTPTLPSHLTAMEFPSQIVRAISDESDPNNNLGNFARAPQLASILFDTPAQQSIESNKWGSGPTLNALMQLPAPRGGIRQLPLDNIEDRATIVKLIFGIVPMDRMTKVPVFEDIPLNHATPSRLWPPASWRTKYLIQENSEAQKCPDNLPDDQGGMNSVPVTCFPFSRVRAGDTSAINQLTRDSQNLAFGQAVNANRHDVYVVLLGVHIMQFSKKTLQWSWMTFYWMKDTNGKTGWSAPWNHYHMMSTTQPRATAQAEHKYCANPYLEGWASVDGLQANCLDCHRFAAYAPSGSSSTADPIQTGLLCGSLSPPQKVCTDEVYFQNAIQTGSIWSIATNQLAAVSSTELGGKAELSKFLQTLQPEQKMMNKSEDGHQR